MPSDEMVEKVARAHPPRPNRRSIAVTIHFHSDQLQWLAERANEAGISLSSYIRRELGP